MTGELGLLRAGLAEHYVVDREIGRGGMASVFLARDTRYNRSVAIKVLHPEVAAAIGVDRFRREIQVVARLTHPGILPVLDSGTCSTPDGLGRLWYAMPYVEGDSLRERITREHQLPIESAVSIVREVADALDYAHRHGIIHRDIKPENILLQGDRPRLADFGIARVIEAEAGEKLTGSGITLGTPAYMSPEQALAEPVDGRSDVYALGCVLYESLTGEPPFTGPTAQALIGRMLSGTPRNIAPVRPQAAVLDPIVMKALARSPADRYATAGEMAAALAQTVGAPTTARRVPDGAQRWRHLAWPVAALVAGAAGFALWTSRSPSAATGTGAARIVVIPFRTTGDSARAYFTSGMTGALRTKLASVPGIEVIAETSTAAATDSTNPAAMARELGASYALTGTVAWDSAGGGTIRVQPQLVSARDGRVVLTWPAPVEAKARNIFDVERDITERIARELNVTLGAAVRARLGAHFGDNPAAYELLLSAGTTQDGKARHEMLLRAVALDSTLGPAWAAIAEDAVVQYVNFGDDRVAEETDVASRKALAVAPHFAESQLVRGLYHRSVTFRHDSAVRYVRRARELAPGDAVVAHFAASALMTASLFDEALAEARRGAGLDPKNTSAVVRVGRVLMWQKKSGEALEIFQPLWRMPAAAIPSFAWFDEAVARLSIGDFTGARVAIDAIPEGDNRRRIVVFLFVQAMLPQVASDSLLASVCTTLPPAFESLALWGKQLICAESARRQGDGARQRSTADSAVVLLRQAVRRGPRHYLSRQRLAWALLLAGDTTQAMAQADSALALRPMSKDAVFGAVNAQEYAQTAALAGDVDRAVGVLGDLLRKPSPTTIAWLTVDPTFDRIRSDAKFQALLKRQ